jgi:hypothetical protein
MFLSISVSINVWLLTVIVARFVVSCLSAVAWSMLLTFFVISMLITMVIHMYHWKCWRYIRHDPQRLRSLTVERSTNSVRVGVILFIWLEAATFVLSTWFCWQELKAVVFLVIVPAAFVTYVVAFGSYTASTCSFSSSEPESLELASNVNAAVSSVVSTSPVVSV